MPTETTSPTPIVLAGSGPWGPAPPVEALWQYVLCDRATDTEIADITTLTTGKLLRRRLSRPSEAFGTAPADHALVNTLWDDGYPILSLGRRALKVRHRFTPESDWQLWHHGMLWYVEDVGGEDSADSAFASYDPLMMLPFRMARGGTMIGGTFVNNGNLSFPVFRGSGANPNRLSGPDLLRQLIRNSISNDSPPNRDGIYDEMEGPLGLDVESGFFEIDAPDLRFDLTAWPKTIGELLTLLTTSGYCDVICQPVDSSMGFDAGTLGSMIAVAHAGYADSIVHYDYATGDHSIRAIRRSLDMSTVTNKLRYLLGGSGGRPGLWDGGSIDATDDEMPDPPQTTIDAMQAASRDAFLVFQGLRVFDDNLGSGPEKKERRQGYMRIWQLEAMLRAEPREMLFITPTVNAPFSVGSINLGDEITINCSDTLRQGFTGRQRVYGFDTKIDDEGNTELDELVVAPEGLG